MINVLIPTLGRAHRIPGIVANVRATSPQVSRVVFCLENHDTESTEVAEAVADEYERGYVHVTVNTRAPNYSGAINSAWGERRIIPNKYWFAGADDLHFESDWDAHALNKFDGWFGVVGTNDKLNPYVQAGAHATHYLVDSDYLEKVGGIVDQGPGSFLFEGYGHNYCDTEFIGTAKMRAKFRPCLESVVTHLHWTTGKTPVDATTDKANATYAADSAIYDSRRDLWFSISR